MKSDHHMSLSSRALGRPMNKIQSEVTVLMVNYRSVDYVRSCVKSLSTEKIDRIIVLENGSGEEEWKQLQEIDFSAAGEVKLVRSLDNVGFGAGVNLASSQLEPDYSGLIWILNPDTVITAGCVSLLVSRITRRELDIVSPVIASGSESSPTIWFVGGDINHSNGSTRHTDFGEPMPVRSGVRMTDFMTGAAPMMSFHTWKVLGGFREDLFLYWEDADLSLRAQDLELGMGIDMSARIWHREGGSGESEGRSSTYYFYMQKNRIMVESQFSSRWNLVIGSGAFETLRLLVRPLRERDRKISKFQASVRGLFAGLKGTRNEI